MKTRLTLDEVKTIELEMLVWFHSICEAHNIQYSLCGGTLLGAIRHKGFIPWDDDIDVCMSRQEYNKFVSLIKKQRIKVPNHYSVNCPELNNTEYPFIKIYDLRTECEIEFKDEENNALWIDVLPVDGLPDRQNDVKKIYKRAAFLRNMILWRMARPGEGKNVVRKAIKPAFIIIAKMFPKMYFTKKMVNLINSNPYIKSDYVGVVVWGLYGIGEKMSKIGFEKKVYVEFEKQKFLAMSCYKEYLTGIYGDYMQLPPLEKRKSHDMVAYRKD